MIALLWLACADDGLDSATTGDGGLAEEAFTDPAAWGPWPVGTEEEAITMSWGVDLAVQTWYPRVDAEGSPHAYDDLLADLALDGGLADCARPRPVVLFSHGNGGMRWQSFFLTQYLASHGFVVVAPDHTGNTVFDMDEDRMPELVFRRPVDIADSFDALLQWSADPAHPLHGCVDPDAGYAMVGHSFGGYTSLAVAGAPIDTEAVAATCADSGGWLCAYVATWAAEHPEQTVWDLGDPRAWAVVPMAPAAYETLAAGLDQVAIPPLILAGSMDRTTPWTSTVEPIYEGLPPAERAAAILEGAGHYHFSDACQLLPGTPECGEEYLPAEEVHPLVQALVLAWIQQARGYEEAAAWLPPEGAALEWREGD